MNSAASTPGGSERADNGYVPGLDGLRALAVGMVLVAHAGYGEFVPGGLGVTIFFAISGYLITTLLVNENSRTGTIKLREFYTRRILRLYPELVALILLCLASGAFWPFTATPFEKLAGLLYYMNYYYVFGPHYAIEHSYPWRQLWSLSVEEHFYFIFPAMLLVIRRWNSRLLAICALILLPFLWRFATYHILGLPWQYNYVATDTRIDSIAWGCLLALLLHGADGIHRPSGDGAFIGLIPLATGIGLLLFTLLYRSEDFRWTWRFSVQGIAIAVLLANLLFDPRWQAIVRAFEWRPVRFIGRISYGLYLYHMLINYWIEAALPPLSRPAFLILSIAISVALASLSYFVIEVPLKPLRRRVGSHVR